MLTTNRYKNNYVRKPLNRYHREDVNRQTETTDEDLNRFDVYMDFVDFMQADGEAVIRDAHDELIKYTKKLNELRKDHEYRVEINDVKTLKYLEDKIKDLAEFVNDYRKKINQYEYDLRLANTQAIITAQEEVIKKFEQEEQDLKEIGNEIMQKEEKKQNEENEFQKEQKELAIAEEEIKKHKDYSEYAKLREEFMKIRKVEERQVNDLNKIQEKIINNQKNNIDVPPELFDQYTRIKGNYNTTIEERDKLIAKMNGMKETDKKNEEMEQKKKNMDEKINLINKYKDTIKARKDEALILIDKRAELKNTYEKLKWIEKNEKINKEDMERIKKEMTKLYGRINTLENSEATKKLITTCEALQKEYEELKKETDNNIKKTINETVELDKKINLGAESITAEVIKKAVLPQEGIKKDFQENTISLISQLNTKLGITQEQKQVEKPVEKKEPKPGKPGKPGKQGEVKVNLAEALKKTGLGLHGEALPVRNIEPPQWRNFINQYGNAEIKNLFVFKQPIQRILTDIFNIISFGKLNQAKTKYGYDELVHTFFIFDTSMGVILMEKNQVLNIHLLTQEEINKLKEIPNIQIDTNRKISHQDFLRDPVFTLNVFIEKGKKYMDQDFVHYNMRTNNCQVFIRDMLIGNDLWEPRYMDFVIQNANEIFNELPQLYNDLVNGLTNSAAFFDYLIYGKALRKKDIF